MEKNILDLQALDDESLIKHIGVDRDLVLSILYDRYENRVFYKALSLLKNRAEAMDLAHDIFIEIFTSLDKFEGKSKLSLWIHSISFNTCVKYLSTKKRLQVFSLDDQEDEYQDHAPIELAEKVLLEMNLDALEEHMGNLKEEDRMIMLLKYIDGLTVKEMSEVTKMNESKIKMKLMRSREKLLHMYYNKPK